MNTNQNSNLNVKLKSRQILCAGMHPEGGFVALPGGKTSRIKWNTSNPQAKNFNRKGFVAWPVKD